MINYKDYRYHDPDRLKAIYTHLQQAKTWITSPIVTMLTFPDSTEEDDIARFRKNIREKIARLVRTSPEKKHTKDNPRKGLVLTIFLEDSEKDRRRHFHALVSVSGHMCGNRGRLHALIDPVWQNIKPGEPVHISSHFHRNLYSDEQNIFDELTYLAKTSQLPNMEPNKKSINTSHWRLVEPADLEELSEFIKQAMR